MIEQQFPQFIASIFSWLQMVYFGTGYVWLMIMVVVWLIIGIVQCLARLLITLLPSCPLPGWRSPWKPEIRIQTPKPNHSPGSSLLLGITLMSMSWGTEEKEISRPQMEDVLELPVCTSANQEPCIQLRWVREVFKQLVVETGFCLFISSLACPQRIVGSFVLAGWPNSFGLF